MLFGTGKLYANLFRLGQLAHNLSITEKSTKVFQILGSSYRNSLKYYRSENYRNGTNGVGYNALLYRYSDSFYLLRKRPAGLGLSYYSDTAELDKKEMGL